MNLTSNWNIWDQLVQMVGSAVASTTIAVFEPSIPDAFDWTLAAGSAQQLDGFRFALCPSPDPAYNWPQSPLFE